MLYEGVGAGTLKYLVGYNHFETRDDARNAEITSDKYLRCGKNKDQKYTTLCKGVEELKHKHMKIIKNSIKRLKI